MELVKHHKKHKGISILSLNRPEKRNALNIELISQLCQAIGEIQKDPQQRVIIITGEGPVFCAGMDLSEAQNPVKAEITANSVANLFKTVYLCPLVTIAAVHGAAFAGGGGLAAACDFTIAEEKTLFSFPETKRGLVAAQVTALLERQISTRHIKELLLFGLTIDAARAKEIGLINRTSPQAQLLDEAVRYAQEAMQGAPKATASTKKIIETLAPKPFSENVTQALKWHNQARESEEAQEGISAFLEKRKPIWLEFKK